VYEYYCEDTVHKFVTDGAANMLKAVKDYEGATCIAHTLALTANLALEHPGMYVALSYFLHAYVLYLRCSWGLFVSEHTP
jgi:hypothetical protein